ncbi:EMYY motif lipoprotein [Lacicoccus qingdaonensis]|uniref:EMYY motif lipoprotein n=1 Tax=Lacicoccus qingdaonensis TaxID=576118 RepID=UPI001FE189B3|nr:EMYY motif lipoprotein [Salinicoccus qingdaonensis]
MKQTVTFNLLLIFILLLSACGNRLAEETEEYQQQMDDIYTINNELTNHLDNIDSDKIQNHISDLDTDFESDELEEMISKLEGEILPLAESLNTKVDEMEVTNEDIEDHHNTFVESAQVKYDFAEQLSDYLSTYQNSVQASERLIDLSQSFMDNQKERDDIIENASDSKAEEEINTLIDQLNSNSEELDEASKILEGDESIESKQEQIDDVLLPMLDEHVDSLNQINLSTQQANRVRSVSLEMYYGYISYYEERKNTMSYNEKLQNVQLQNILSLQESYQRLDEDYTKELEELKSGE